MSKKIKILHYVPFMNTTSGITQLIYSFWSNIDHNKYSFDILHHNWRAFIYEDSDSCKKMFEDVNVGVYSICDLHDGFFKHIAEVNKFFDKHKNEYDVVHCHTVSSALPFLKVAKKNNINSRILHSHSAKSSEKLLNQLRNRPFNYLARKYATLNLACSVDAGKCLFGNEKFTIVENGVNIDNYMFDKNAKEQYYKELRLDKNTFVIGASGRISKEKNYTFMIDIFEALKKEKSNAVLVIVGDGPDRDILRSYIKSKHIEDSVILLKDRKDMNKLYSLFDVFCMTSYYEGIPVVAIEAQASGLPCVFSDSITQHLNVSNDITFVSLKSSIDVWIKALLKGSSNTTRKCSQKLMNSDFSSKNSTKKLEKIYEKITTN